MCPDGCFDTVSVYALHGCKLHCEKLTMFHEQMDGLNGKGKKNHIKTSGDTRL